jgi:hypothetical protein
MSAIMRALPASLNPENSGKLLQFRACYYLQHVSRRSERPATSTIGDSIVIDTLDFASASRLGRESTHV